MHGERAPVYVPELGLFYYDGSQSDSQTKYGNIRFEYIGNTVGWRGAEMDRINNDVCKWIKNYHNQIGA